MSLKPIQLAAHQRPITKIRINKDGDLMFSTGKDGKAMAWYLSDGMRLGTFEGHNGSLNDFAVDNETEYCLTAGADCAFGVWKCCNGELLRLIEPNSPDRVTTVRWSCGDKQFSVSTIGSKKAYTRIYDFDPAVFKDKSIPSEEIKPVCVIPPVPGDGEPFLGHTKKISESLWGPMNEFVYTASEDGTIRRWNVSTQELNTMVNFNPEKATEVTSMDYSKDKTLIIATGRDETARLYEGESLTPLKVFRSDKPLNCAVLHPTLNLVMVGGGQSAHAVTTTGHGQGKFEVQFFHTIFEEKVGEIRTGHFSPINYLAISLDGTVLATGAEEGNCRIFKFDAAFANKFKALEKSFVNMGPSVTN